MLAQDRHYLDLSYVHLRKKKGQKPRKTDLHLRLGTRSMILGQNKGHPDLTSAREYRLDQTRQQ